MGAVPLADAWRRAWAVLSGALGDELGGDALEALRVAFNLRSARSVHELLRLLNDKNTFTGQKAKKNVRALLEVLRLWQHVPAVAAVARASAQSPWSSQCLIVCSTDVPLIKVLFPEEKEVPLPGFNGQLKQYPARPQVYLYRCSDNNVLADVDALVALLTPSCDAPFSQEDVFIIYVGPCTTGPHEANPNCAKVPLKLEMRLTRVVKPEISLSREQFLKEKLEAAEELATLDGQLFEVTPLFRTIPSGVRDIPADCVPYDHRSYYVAKVAREYSATWLALLAPNFGTDHHRLVSHLSVALSASPSRTIPPWFAMEVAGDENKDLRSQFALLTPDGAHSTNHLVQRHGSIVFTLCAPIYVYWQSS